MKYTGLKILLFFVLAMLADLCPVNAQTINQIVKAGDAKFMDADYYTASLYYLQALAKNEDNAEVRYKYADACRLFNDYKNAAAAYSAVLRSDKATEFPFISFWLGEMQKSTGLYSEAIKQFQRFIGRHKEQDFYAAKAKQELESCAWAKEHWKQMDTIRIIHLGKDVNTEASEFNAIHVYPDKLQFSSLRNLAQGKEKDKYLVRIYNQPPNPELIFTPQGADADLNIGNGAYTPDARKFYFTQCEARDKVSSRCDIYVSKYVDYKWTAAEKLSSAINDPKATNTQPAPGYDLSGNEVLFFVSDREGGKGNMDVWISQLNKDGTYGNPVNAGDKINTPGNEVTPFYDLNSKKLYFSSDWHFGFGGYDIFSSTGESTNWNEPQNLLRPSNTPQNDLYYTAAPDNSKVYITSNRVGSYFIKAETCCNDIYAYANPKKTERKIDTTTVVVKQDTPVVIKDTTTTTIIAKDTTTTPVAVTTEEPRKLIDVTKKNTKQRLSVNLYFHNDEPDCCNLRDTTNLDYKETYEAYTSLINEYKKEFGKGLKGDTKANSEKEINDLFAKVDQGFYDLVAFSSQMYDLLQAGDKIEVTVKGYCSPLNYNDYNIKLGYRRVASLRNYFYHYRDGIFLPFIANGTLKLVNESFGEEKAAKEVSDNLRDTRNSVYSPAAALERRVEIISVELK